jgi:predicted RNA-binding protein with PIN domain
MSLLIDGYNLIYAAGIVGRGSGPGGLQRSRLALLNFLAESLDLADLPRTTVVFDAHDAPRGVPRQVGHRGMTVRFAVQYHEADDLIVELIRADSAPRRLIVVSSDHQIQRAARRRKAQAIDSDVWYADLLRVRRERQEAFPDAAARPAVPLLAEDVNYWLRQFGGESAFADLFREEIRRKPSTSRKPSEPSETEAGPLDNPFPPGYGEDIQEGSDM